MYVKYYANERTNERTRGVRGRRIKKLTPPAHPTKPTTTKRQQTPSHAPRAKRKQIVYTPFSRRLVCWEAYFFVCMCVHPDMTRWLCRQVGRLFFSLSLVCLLKNCRQLKCKQPNKNTTTEYVPKCLQVAATCKTRHPAESRTPRHDDASCQPIN